MTAMPTREVTWGEGLVVAGFRAAGGLNVAVNRIQRVLGPQIGARNTFAKLYHVTDPNELGDRDRFRAWLVLTALGEDPEDWGVSSSVVPLGYDAERLRSAIRDPEWAPSDSNRQPADYTIRIGDRRSRPNVIKFATIDGSNQAQGKAA